ncbi:MAG: hypothetical protein QMD85_05760, partial [Candidatus Aenigmarchaeota archaeon]|nr:hypothetical protein [Candidatus Aenigmarchaeota archaeon]
MKKYLFVAVLLLASAAMAQVISTVDSLTVPEGNIKIIPEERVETGNGILLSLGYVRNDLNFAVMVRNITFGGENINADIVVKPNSTWMYARLDGILILPKTPARIDATKTSFYRTGGQLHISLNETDEMDIYFRYLNVPRIVAADKDIRWSFQDSRLNIVSNDRMNEIDIYWTDVYNDTVLLFDRRKAESLTYKISGLVYEAAKRNGTVAKSRSGNEKLKS